MSLRWLALGDSYTIGEGVPEAGRWPVQLAAALRREGIAIADPRIVAVTGWTTDELDAGIDAAVPAGPYDLVSLAIGVNNQYRGRAPDEYAVQLHALLQRAVAFADGDAARVFMLSIPDWGSTPFAIAQGRDAATIAREIDGYNRIADGLCTHAGIAFIDITGLSRASADPAHWLADDGLHPSAAQYARWVEAALPVVRGLLAA